MAAPIDFYFDFSSPYGYLASEKIDSLAAKYGRTVNWKPILLGAVFKVSGMAPLTEVPLKGVYSKHDFARSARYHGVAYRHPDAFPISTVNASRAFLWAEEKDAAKAKALAHALYRAYFQHNVNISETDTVLRICGEAGLSIDEARTAIGDQKIKDKLRIAVEGAIARGVFGSPFVFVDNEPFWGVDRFDQIERWLKTGGF